MSAGQVSEWLHADKGSPWKHRAVGGGLSMGPPADYHPPHWRIPRPDKPDDQGTDSVDQIEQSIIRSQIDPSKKGQAAQGGRQDFAWGGPPGAISPFMPTMPDRTNDPWPDPNDPTIHLPPQSPPPQGQRPSPHPSQVASPGSAGGMMQYLGQIYGGLNQTGAGGVPAQAAGGRVGYEVGGDVMAAGSMGSGMPIGGGNPLVSGMMQRFAQMPPEQLQELSVRIPPNTAQGQMIQRALMQQHMRPQQSNQMVQQRMAQQGAAVGPTGAASPQVAPPPAAPQMTQQQPQQPVPMQAMGTFADGGAIGKALHSAKTFPRQKFDMGGMSMGEMVPFSARQANREIVHEGGLLQSEIPGRTDHIPLSVAAGSYVLPADVVAGLGEGNTLSGANILNRALGVGPWGTKEQRPAQHHTLPGGQPLPTAHPPHPYPDTEREKVQYADGGGVSGWMPSKFAGGGNVPPHEQNIHGERQTVPVVVAGGEYVVPPNVVAFHPKLGGGSPDMPPKHKEMALKKGHDTLDAFVKSARAKHVKEISKLPGPAK